MIMNRSFSLLFVLSLSLLFFAICGCEEDIDIGDTDSYFKDSQFSSEPGSSSDLIISPESTTITNNGSFATFTADGGTSPYTWSVQYSSLGSIVSQSDDSTVYRRDASGNNAVILQDSNGNKVLATVDQPTPSVTALSISPESATITNNGGFAAFTASGGTLPYTWSVNDITKGWIVSSGGDNAVYMRLTSGDNAVYLQDSGGSKAYAVINQ